MITACVWGSGKTGHFTFVGFIPASFRLVVYFTMLQAFRSMRRQGRDYWCIVKDLEGTGLTKSRKQPVNTASAPAEILTGRLTNKCELLIYQLAWSLAWRK